MVPDPVTGTPIEPGWIRKVATSIATDTAAEALKMAEEADERLRQELTYKIANQLKDIIRAAIQAAISDVIPEMVTQAVAEAIKAHENDKHFWRQEYPDKKNLPFKYNEYQRQEKPYYYTVSN